MSWSIVLEGPIVLGVICAAVFVGWLIHEGLKALYRAFND